MQTALRKKANFLRYLMLANNELLKMTHQNRSHVWWEIIIIVIVSFKYFFLSHMPNIGSSNFHILAKVRNLLFNKEALEFRVSGDDIISISRWKYLHKSLKSKIEHVRETLNGSLVGFSSRFFRRLFAFLENLWAVDYRCLFLTSKNVNQFSRVDSNCSQAENKLQEANWWTSAAGNHRSRFAAHTDHKSWTCSVDSTINQVKQTLEKHSAGRTKPITTM